MKFKFKCLFGKHTWLTGRVVSDHARNLVPDEKSYHNRACAYCPKEEWNADEIEAEADRITFVREMLRETKRVAKIKPVAPKKLILDPDEFP